MASKVEICNIALTFIGQKPILSLDEESKSARLLSRIWDTVRDEVLRSHPWNFAIARATCARLSVTPAYGYAYTYQQPSDCLRVLEVGEIDDEIDARVEGRHILTDEATCPIRYIYRVTDTNDYDSLFVMTLASRLSFYCAYGLAASPSQAKNMLDLNLGMTTGAKAVDGQEGGLEVLRSNDLINARK